MGWTETQHTRPVTGHAPLTLTVTVESDGFSITAETEAGEQDQEHIPWTSLDALCPDHDGMRQRPVREGPSFFHVERGTIPIAPDRAVLLLDRP